MPRDDWWDALYNSDDKPTDNRPRPRFIVFERPRHDDSDGARDARFRRLGAVATSAVAAWACGLAPTWLGTLHSIGREHSPSGAVVAGLALLFMTSVVDRVLMGLIDHWLPEPFRPPVRIAAHVPLLAAVMALAFYAPGSTTWGGGA